MAIQGMTTSELEKLCVERAAVPIRVAAKAMGIAESAAYAAARDGKIVTIQLGKNLRRVPTAWLRKVLLEDPLQQPAA